MPLFRRILNLLRRSRIQQDIDAELRSHIEMRIEDNTASGMSPEEARRDAEVRFGNRLLLAEKTGDVELFRPLQDFWRDLGYAARQFARSSGFAVTAILTLALALSVNVIVISVLNSLLWTNFTPEGSGRLFNIVQGPHGYDSQSYPDYLDYRDRNTAFTGLAAYRIGQTGLTFGTQAYKCWDYEVSGNYFDLLSVRPALGRFFHATDEHGPNSAPYVVLSDAFWRSRFAADPHITGATVRLNRHPFTIVGVAPRSFHGTEHVIWPDFWMPMVNEQQVEGNNFLDKRFNHGISIIGLLKPSYSFQQATDNLNAVAARLAQQYPNSNEGMRARLVVTGLMGDELGDAARAFLSAATIMAFLVLLAACANLAGIFAARATDRSRELAIRLSIGASRWRILRQLLTESVFLSLLGGLLGTLFAATLLRVLTQWQPFAQFPIHVVVLPGARVYVVAALLSLASGILPGLLAARQLWRTDLTQAVKNASGLPAFRHRFTVRDLLLGAQVALCALLLTASLVALRGMQRSLHTPFGFQPQGVILAETDMHMANYSGAESFPIQQRMIEEVARIRGVRAVGLINETPLGTGGSTSPVYAADTTDFRPTTSPFAAKFYSVSPGYREAAGTRLLSGRDFTWHDNLHSPPVALVNQTFAQRLFGGLPAVGRRFKTSADNSYEIVGIVEDGKYDSLTETPKAAMFFPLAQNPDTDTTVVVRADLPPAQITPALSETLHRIDPDLPFVIHRWTEALAFVLFPAQAAAVSLGCMGLLAALLAVTGVFGVAAYTISKRRKELGIRIALGARSLQVLQTALARPLTLLLLGSAGGLLCGLLASRLMEQIVYEATPRDALVWLGVIVIMLLLGASAIWIPARRALRINPALLLKEDL